MPQGIRFRRATGAKALLYVIALTALALIAIPVGYLVVRAAGAGPDAWARLLDLDTVALALRSLGLAAAVAISGVLIATPYAFLTVRCNLPGRQLWAVLGALPLVIPSYVGALALIGAFGPRGLLQQVLEPLGVERLPAIYGFVGAWTALTLFTYPYVLLIVSSAWRRVDVSLERAARSAGLNSRQTFLRATLPQLRSSIVAGALLCALYALSDFGVVSLMRYNTFTRAIFVHYRSLFDREGAALLSLILCVLTVGVLVLERRVLRGSAFGGRRRVQASDAGSLVRLGKWTAPALLFCLLVSGFALIVPIGVLLWWISSQTADLPISEQFATVWPAIVDSLSGSLLAAIVCVLLALPIAVLSVRSPGRLTGAIEAATYTGFALPGVVAALGLVFYATRYVLPLYQTLALLVVAYVIRFLPQAVGASRAAVERVSPTLEAAARGMGETGSGTFRRVTLPLAGPGVLAGGMLVFLTAMKELPATLILRPIGFDTLATEIWRQAAVADYPEAALPALVLIAISAVPLWLLVIRPGATETGSAD